MPRKKSDPMSWPKAAPVKQSKEKPFLQFRCPAVINEVSIRPEIVTVEFTYSYPSGSCYPGESEPYPNTGRLCYTLSPAEYAKVRDQIVVGATATIITVL